MSQYAFTLVELLTERGADVNQADARGNTPLHYAALSDYGDAEIARLLLAAGAKREVKNKDGLTPRVNSNIRI